MDAAEHYVESERLLRRVEHIVQTAPVPHAKVERLLAQAQVHATLAVAAATAPGLVR